MGERLRRCQDDNRIARPPDPPLPHPRDWKRQLPIQKQLGPRGQNQEGEKQELDRRTRPERYMRGGSVLGGNAGSVLSGNQHAIALSAESSSVASTSAIMRSRSGRRTSVRSADGVLCFFFIIISASNSDD